MKIGLNVSPLSKDHKTRGVGIYTQLLIHALEKYSPEIELSFFEKYSSIDPDVQAIHIPFFDPFFITLPKKKSHPTVVTVHDVIPIAYPQQFPRGIRGEIKWQVQKTLLHMIADRIITDSESSKNDIVGLVGVDDQAIDVIYLAPADTFRPESSRSRIADVKKKYNLPKQYLLYVGDVNWNKNIPRLLRCFSEIQKKHPQVQLLLVGKAFLNATILEVKMINALIQTFGLESHVRQLGFVPKDDLVALYTKASACIQISLAEGYGFPVVEAMACGCPVVTSNVSSLSEIAGPSLQVDPKDEYDIITSILDVLSTDQSKRKKAGMEWVKQFTWKRVAHETAAVYAKLIHKNS